MPVRSLLESNGPFVGLYSLIYLTDLHVGIYPIGIYFDALSYP